MHNREDSAKLCHNMATGTDVASGRLARIDSSVIHAANVALRAALGASNSNDYWIGLYQSSGPAAVRLTFTFILLPTQAVQGLLYR